MERYGQSFAVFVDGDPTSIRQFDTPAKRQAFIEGAAVRPWEGRPFPSARVQEPIVWGSSHCGPSPDALLERRTELIRILISFLAVTLTLPAQKIDTETPARDRVVRVQTALNHLTVIEVSEPVTTVAVGSPQAFKVERRENKVFIQPLQEGVATNLFIWTSTTRLNYELVPAISDTGQMDFAIDYRQPQREAQAQPAAPPKPVEQSVVPGDMLLHSAPVKLVGFPRSKQPQVDIAIRDVYRTENEVFIRYAIENRSKTPYQPSTPHVVSLKSPQCDRSLTSLVNSQLGDEYLAHLRWYGTVTMPVVHAETPSGAILPGTNRVGLIAVQLPPAADPKVSSTPTVLRMVFPGDGPRQVIATLVF